MPHDGSEELMVEQMKTTKVDIETYSWDDISTDLFCVPDIGLGERQ